MTTSDISGQTARYDDITRSESGGSMRVKSLAAGSQPNGPRTTSDVLGQTARYDDITRSPPLLEDKSGGSMRVKSLAAGSQPNGPRPATVIQTLASPAAGYAPATGSGPI